MSEKCPVCCSEVPEPGTFAVFDMQVHLYSCPRCGSFEIENRTFKHLRNGALNDREKAALSHWIRTRHNAMADDEQSRPKTTVLDRILVGSIIKNPHPSPAEQANTFIRWVGDNSEVAGRYIQVDQLAILSIIGCANYDEFRLIFGHLADKGFIKSETIGTGHGCVLMRVLLLFPGWERYQELKRTTFDSRKAFMAMQFNEPLLDEIVDSVFRPAVKQAGFDLSILPPRAGLIDDTLRVAIQASRFLIADLTHENRGAYWEAGYAEGLGRPVIYTCEKNRFEESKTHFDTNHHLTVRWDSEKRKETGDELKATIRATLPAEAKLTDD